MITAFAHACFVVSDLEKSIRFYQGSLGLRHAFDFKNEKGVRTGVYLHAGGRSFIELFQGSVDVKEKGTSFQHICLEVDDIDATVKALRVKGVEASDPFLAKDNSWQAWITDPDGNRIELHCYTATSWQAPHVK